MILHDKEKHFIFCIVLADVAVIIYHCFRNKKRPFDSWRRQQHTCPPGVDVWEISWFGFPVPPKLHR